MQKRGLTCTRRRHQRDRLSRPQRELGAVENGQCRFPLRVLAFYLVEIDDRYIFRPLLHLALTRTGARRRDRGGRHAMTDRAWRGRTASAPLSRPRWVRRNRSRPAAWRENKAPSKTIRFWSARLK